MQTTASRFWTRVVDFISFDDNRYINYVSTVVCFCEDSKFINVVQMLTLIVCLKAIARAVQVKKIFWVLYHWWIKKVMGKKQKQKKNKFINLVWSNEISTSISTQYD